MSLSEDGGELACERSSQSRVCTISDTSVMALVSYVPHQRNMNGVARCRSGTLAGDAFFKTAVDRNIFSILEKAVDDSPHETKKKAL